MALQHSSSQGISHEVHLEVQESGSKILPWLLKSNLEKFHVIKSHLIGPKKTKREHWEVVQVGNKKLVIRKNWDFEVAMNKIGKALLSRAKREVEQYTSMPSLVPIKKSLSELLKKLQRTRKSVLLRMIRTLVMTPRMRNMLDNVLVTVNNMLFYIKKFQAYIKGKLLGLIDRILYNPITRLSTEADLISIITRRETDKFHCLISLDDSLDQKSAAKLVESALKCEIPRDKLIIPKNLRVRVGEGGKVEMY